MTEKKPEPPKPKNVSKHCPCHFCVENKPSMGPETRPYVAGEDAGELL